MGLLSSGGMALRMPCPILAPFMYVLNCGRPRSSTYYYVRPLPQPQRGNLQLHGAAQSSHSCCYSGVAGEKGTIFFHGMPTDTGDGAIKRDVNRA